MEQNYYTEEKSRRKLEHSVLAIYTLFSLATFASGLFLHWNIFVEEYYVAATIVPWIVYGKNFWNYKSRAKFLALLSWINLFVYAMFSDSFTSVSCTMFTITVLMGVFCVQEVVYLGVVVSTVIIVIHIFVLRTYEINNASEFIRLLFHIISSYVISLVTLIVIRARIETSERLMGNIRELQSVEQSKDDFLVNVSHEIRTPINAVCGMSEAILQENLPANVRSDIIDIQTAGRNLLATVSNILDFSELESGKMEVVEESYNITSTITDIINMALTLENGKRIELIVDCDANLPNNLLGDEQKLRRIVLNLLDNAIKFTKEGGIILRVSSRKEEYGINLNVSVRDSGIGMSQADMEKIFNSFSQLDSKRNREEGGVGLGLSITQALVRNMGGFLSIESKPKVGTEFQFTIPQKVLDETPIVSIKNKSHLFAACYINMGKYNYSVVREGYEQSIRHMAEQLGIMFRICKNLPELKRRIEIENYSHVFIGWEEYCEDRDFFEQLAQDLTVVLILDYGQETRMGSRMLRIYKPFTVLSIAAIFNGQRLIQREDPNADLHHHFVAPDAKVLVVDDNAMNLKVMARLLLPYQIKVMTALGGKEALGMIDSMDYDFVFLDHMMPEMDGVETLHKMRQKPGAYFQSLPIIAFTANAIGGAREMFMEEGFDDFIAKPIELSVLERMLRRYVPMQKQIAVEPGTRAGKSDNVHGDGLQTSGVGRAVSDQGSGAGVAKAQSGQFEDDGLNALEQAGINVKLGFSYCGDREGFRDIVRMYHAQGAGRNSQLEQLYIEENWKDYAIAVHALKSNSKGIGAEALAELALNLEMAGKENRADYILEHHEELIEKHNELLHALAANSFIYPEGYRDSESEGDGAVQSAGKNGEVDKSTAEETQQEADADSLEKQMELLREKLDNYESEGLNDILVQLAKYRYHDIDFKEMTAEIKSRTDEFDFLGASDILDSWEDRLAESTI
ncbi:MAG: response regulator [Lachnospiraceae bacterium]|nr:response regulator [Lachnospiraceae bacterium]